MDAARIDAFEARLRRLEDEQAIAQLIATYGPAVDSGSADAAAVLWLEDGVFDVVGMFELAGRDAIAGMVLGEGHQGLIQHGCGHVLTAPKVVVDGDAARAWCYAFNVRWDAEHERFWVARLSANRWELQRTSNGWRVARRTNVNLDGDQRPRDLLATAVSSDDVGA